MPNRVIREGLLDSQRYMAVQEGAQLFFNHLLLLADDFGCVSLAPSFVGRRCFAQRPPDERLERLISELADVDLIRVYESAGGKYAFIPRFRQRLKRETLKNPKPPESLLLDDDDAMEKFKQLNGHAQKGAAVRRDEGAGVPPQVRPPDIEVKRSEEKGSEEKGLGLRVLVDPEKAKPEPENPKPRRNAVQIIEDLAARMAKPETP